MKSDYKNGLVFKNKYELIVLRIIKNDFIITIIILICYLDPIA